MKRIVTRVNDVLCGPDSPVHFACGRATKPDPTYTRTLVISLLIHAAQSALALVLGTGWAFIIAPVLLFFYLIIALTGGLAAIAFIPVFVPVGIIASVLVLILAVAYAIVYYGYYFTRIGSLVIIPFIAGLVGFAIWFIPVIGVFISTGIFLIPWMPIAIALHRFMYSS